MGVVSMRWVWMESMGVATGCGCKEVYRFPHITPTCLVFALFYSSIPTFCSFLTLGTHAPEGYCSCPVCVSVCVCVCVCLSATLIWGLGLVEV